MKFRWFRRILNLEDRPEENGGSPRNEFHDSSIILSQGVYRQSVDEDSSVEDEVVLRRPQNASSNNSRNSRRHSDRESFFEKFIPFRSTLNLARFSLESEHHISSIQLSSHLNQHRQQDVESQVKNDKLKKMIHERLSMQNMSVSMPNLSTIKEHQHDQEHANDPPKNGVSSKSSHKRPNKRPPPQPPLPLVTAVDVSDTDNESEPIKPPRRKPTSPVAVVAPLMETPVVPPVISETPANPSIVTSTSAVAENIPMVLEPVVTMRAAISDHSLDSDTESMTPSIRFSMSELNSVLVATTPAIVIQEVDDDGDIREISRESTDYEIKPEIPTPAKRASLAFLKEFDEKFEQESVGDNMEAKEIIDDVAPEPTKSITITHIQPEVEDPLDVPVMFNSHNMEVTVVFIDNGDDSITDVIMKATEIPETAEVSAAPDKLEVTDKTADNISAIQVNFPDFPEAEEVIEIPTSTFSSNNKDGDQSAGEKSNIPIESDDPNSESGNSDAIVITVNQVDTETTNSQQVAPIPPKRHSKSRKEPPQVAPRKSLELMNGVDEVDAGISDNTVPKQLDENSHENSEISMPSQNQNDDEIWCLEDPDDTTLNQSPPRSILKSTESSSERTNMTIRFHDEISEIRSNFTSLTPIREDAPGIEDEDSDGDRDDKNVEFSVWDAMEDHRISLEHLNKKKTTTPPPSPISPRKSDAEIVKLKIF